MMRFRGAIAWAKFELPKAPVKAPQYRAGVEFTDADAKAHRQCYLRAANQQDR